MEGDELCFTFHLEESNNPENLHWDVKRNQSEIIQFYDQCKVRNGSGLQYSNSLAQFY